MNAPIESQERNPFDSRGKVFNGMNIPFFGEGGRGPQILSAKDMNLMVSLLRALANPKTVQGDVWDVRLSDSDFTIQIGNPQSPNPGGAGLQPFRLKSVQGDYVTARTWDGSSDGPTDIFLAKEFWLRNSVTSATVLTVSHSYSYGAGPDSNNVYRTNSDGTNSESEIVLPPFVVNEIVYAVTCNTLVNDGGGNPITWLMLRSCEWAKISPVAVAPSTPATSSDTTNGYTSGLIQADTNYIYVSVGSNSWKRVAIATW